LRIERAKDVGHDVDRDVCERMPIVVAQLPPVGLLKGC
jgi:hypothetical protein